METFKIPLKKIYNNNIKNDLKIVEGELLLFLNHTTIIMITNVTFPTEEIIYGRRKNKKKLVEYVELRIIGYNKEYDFMGIMGKENTLFIINQYDLLAMKHNYNLLMKENALMIEKQQEYQKKIGN